MAGNKSAGASWLLVAAMAVALSCAAVGAARTIKDQDSNDQDDAQVEFVIYFPDDSYSYVFGPDREREPISNRPAFGKGKVFDFPVYGPGGVTEVGHARGFSFVDSEEGDGSQVAFTVSFHAGDYPQSSIVFGGRFDESHQEQGLENESRQGVHIAVTGGTGWFRFSTGAAEAERFTPSDEGLDEPAYKVQVYLRDVRPPVEPASF